METRIASSLFVALNLGAPAFAFSYFDFFLFSCFEFGYYPFYVGGGINFIGLFVEIIYFSQSVAFFTLFIA